jgi:nitrate reductase delta subunit
MRILKVISALLAYPSADMQGALEEMASVVEGEDSLSCRDKAGLLELIDGCRNTSLIEWQQTYVELFDRGRNLSLHLFEHVHGESRDRGQAMVDLMEIYREHGFEIAARELPDYIPLFLEYLSQRPRDEALDLLCHATPVLKLLGTRLTGRNSPYAALFAALTSLAGEVADVAPAQAAAEEPDDALLRMDEIWEEEAVAFLGNPKGCTTSVTESRPVKFTARRDIPAASML